MPATRSDGTGLPRGRATGPTLLALAALLAAVVLAPTTPATATTCLDGTGTSLDPFLVASATDLAKVGSGTDGCDADKHYLQTADITLTGNWTPLSGGTAFAGTYDGDGHTISELTVSGASAYRGLFARATTGAEFRDLTLSDVDVEGISETGGLVGDLGPGTVTDVTVTGSVTGSGSWVAGIAGKASGGTFERVRFEGDVTSTGGGTEIAGIVGQLGPGTILDATVEADVTSEHRFTGGVVGSVAGGGVVRRATFSGAVSVTTSTTEVGGIAGSLGSGTMEDSHASGSVTGPTIVGGLVGILASGAEVGLVTGSSFSGTVTATGQTAGGLLGQATGTPSIVASWSTGSVTGSRTVGGLVGYMTAGSVTASYSTAAVSIDEGSNTDDPNLGGLIGDMVGVTLTDVYARGGLTDPTASDDDAGGLVGDLGDSSPDNIIQRAYATGAVPGSGATVGGLAGGSNGDVDSDSFWDTVTSGQAASTAGTAKTTAQMTSIATFNDTATDGLTTAWPIVAGWQPYVAGTTVWGICERVNDGYPFLLWQYDSDPCTDPVAAPTLAVACPTDAAGTLPVGTPITCTLTGGDPDIDILWRAASNPTFAEGVVRTGTDGTGTLALTIPPTAAGSPITVELVAWTAPLPVGTAAGTTAGGPIPTAIPAGDGPDGRSGPASIVLVLLAALAVRAAVAPRRRPSTGHA